MIKKIEMSERLELEAVAIRIREFFRFCGVLVNYTTAEKDQESICFKVTIEECEIPRECSVVLSASDSCSYALNTVLNEFKTVIFEKNETNEWVALDMLKEIYISYQLDYHIYNLIHFHSIYGIMEEALESFKGAFVSLNREKENSFAVIYAKMACARRANEICNLQDKKLCFKTDKIVDYLFAAAQKYNVNAVSAYLAGQMLFADPVLRDESGIYFEKALQDGIGMFFRSNIYYYMGVQAQWIEGKLEKEAARFYMKSFMSNKKCYRACYKMGMYYMNHGDGDEAEKYFMNIINCMEPKLHYLQPIEKLYLFKATQRIASIFADFKNNKEKARQYEADVAELIASSKDHDPFICDFYGEKSEQFKGYLSQRFYDLRVDQVF